MRIAIFGAGSIGCYVGGQWVATGLDVVFVGRNSIRKEIARHGLTLTGDGQPSIKLPPEAAHFAEPAAALAGADLVTVCVKGPATQQAAMAIGRYAPPSASVLSLQNGISPAEALRAALPGRVIMGGVVGYNVAHQGDGRFHRGTAGRLHVEDAPTARALAPLVAGTSGAIELRSDIEDVAWGKLLLNLNNAVNALSGLTLREQLSIRAFRRVLAASQAEALDVLKAAGINPAKMTALPPSWLPGFVSMPDAIFNTIGLRLQKIDAHARSSMADDFAAGRPTEIDALNGEIVRLAARIGRTAPVNARIVDLVRRAETGGRRDWPGEDLLKAVRN